MYEFAIIWDWLAFGVRWLHVITGIAWIGSSFYFVALDLGLKKVPHLPPGAYGEEWQVLCDADHYEETHAVVWHLSHVAKTTPTLLAVDLPLGHTVWRDAPWLPWQTARL